MAQLKVDLTNQESMALAIRILMDLMDEVPVDVNDIDAGQVDDIGDMVGGEDTSMDDLLGAMEPDEPKFTVEAMKDSFRALVKAKGKDAGVALVKKALAKLGVDKMEEVPEDKREAFIKILDLTAAKK